MLSWFRTARRSTIPFRKPSATFRPALDVLEDRIVPVAYLVTGSGDVADLATTGGSGTDEDPFQIASIRSAIQLANGDTSPDTITFAPSLAGSTITLTIGQLEITTDVAITGLGAAQLTVNGDNAFHVFNVDDGAPTAITVVIDGLTITGGNTDGIFNTENLTLKNSTVSGNSGFGAGIHSVGGSLNIDTANISNNLGTGILATDVTTVSVSNSTVDGNFDDGLKVDGATGAITLTDTTFNNNGDDGLNLENVMAVQMTNVTANNNQNSNDNGGGAFIDGATSVTITGGTYNGNQNDGIELDNVSGNVTLTNVTVEETVLFNGFHADDITGSVTIVGGSFSNNKTDGIDLDTVGPVILQDAVMVMGNDRGIIVIAASSFSDTDGNVSNNDNGGIVLEDVAGDVTLIRTTLRNNNANNDLVGDGLRVIDAGDGDAFAIGGNLVVQGALFGDTTGGIQRNGAIISNGSGTSSIAGNATFEDSSGVVQSVQATGNQLEGIFLDGVAGVVSLIKVNASSNVKDGVLIDRAAAVNATGGTYNMNQDDGLNAKTITGAVTLSGDVTANSNINNGLLVSTAGSVSVTGGTFSSNDIDGLLLQTITGAATLSGVTANTQRLGAGMEVVGAGSVVITGGMYNNNDDDGILLQSINGAVTLSGGVTASNNGLSGLFVGSAASVSVTGGTFNGNDANNNSSGQGITLITVPGPSTLDGITANSNNGGGVQINSGIVGIINGSTIDGNRATFGAGVQIQGGTVTIANSTISNNTATGIGGGAHIDPGATANITNSTFSANFSNAQGGGIDNAGTLTVVNSTFTLNAADTDNNSVAQLGGGIFTESGASTTLHNTILAGNLVGGTDINDTSIPFDDLGGANVQPASSFNLIGDPFTAGGLTNNVNGNILDQSDDTTTILDLTLADNGGATKTHLLVQNSPAIGAGSKNVPGYIPYDQRLAARDANAPDIGAFEVHHPLAPVGVPTTYEETFLPKPSASDNEAFVKGLYQSTLLRGGDAGGIGYWVGQLNAGVSRFDVAFGFVNSNENRRNQVTFFYRYFLDRTADEGGLNFHVQRLLSGVDEGEVMTGFVLSDEFSGQNSNEQFVNLMYYALLGRQADAGGFNFWMNQLSSGARTRGGVVPDFLRADETIDRVTNAFAGSYIKREIDAFSQTNLRNASKAGATFGNLAAQILALDEFFAAAGNNL